MTFRFDDEVIGTDGTDIFAGDDDAISFGLAGADTFSGADDDDGFAAAGGGGGDAYTVTEGEGAIILENGNSAGDVLNAPRVDDTNTTFAEIDGKHLYFEDEVGDDLVRGGDGNDDVERPGPATIH